LWGHRRDREPGRKLGGPLLLMLCSCLACFALYYQSQKSRQDVAVLAAICLFMGPTPHETSADFRLAAAFPVPGFCESLISATCEVPAHCQRAFTEDSLPGDCLFYGPSFNCTKASQPIDFKNFMVLKMQQICLSMWQPSPQILGLDGVLRPVAHYRETDTALEDRVFAAPFWCSFGNSTGGSGVGQFYHDMDLSSTSAWVSSVFSDPASALANCSRGPLRWRNLTAYPSIGTFPSERSVAA